MVELCQTGFSVEKAGESRDICINPCDVDTALRNVVKELDMARLEK